MDVHACVGDERVCVRVGMGAGGRSRLRWGGRGDERGRCGGAGSGRCGHVAGVYACVWMMDEVHV